MEHISKAIKAHKKLMIKRIRKFNSTKNEG